MKRQWDEDELAEQWMLAPDELALVANKAGPTRLGFAVLLKVFGRDGRFPRSRQEVAGAVVVHLAKQVGVPAEQYLQYDWRGRAIKYHRAQIRTFFGFREPTVQDGEALVAWRETARTQRVVIVLDFPRSPLPNGTDVPHDV